MKVAGTGITTCPNCGSDAGWLIVSPVSGGHWALCRGCAVDRDFFCVRHESEHQGFADGKTACLFCIEEIVEAHRGSTDEIYQQALSSLEGDLRESLFEWAEDSSDLTWNTPQICILRALATLAVRDHYSLEEILANLPSSIAWLAPF